MVEFLPFMKKLFPSLQYQLKFNKYSYINKYFLCQNKIPYYMFEGSIYRWGEIPLGYPQKILALYVPKSWYSLKCRMAFPRSSKNA